MKSLKSYLIVLLLLSSTALRAQQLIQSREMPTAYNIWRGFDFRTTPPSQFEAKLADFLMLSTKVSKEDGARLLNSVLDSALLNNAYVSITLRTTDQFYKHPNSPYRDELRFIEILKRVIDDPKIADDKKLSPRIVLEQLLKNSVGKRAANFGYETTDGAKGDLHSIEAEYTILFFNDPECQECANIKRMFTSDQRIAGRKDIKVLAIYTDPNVELWRKGTHPRSEQWINAYDPSQMVNKEQLYHITALPTLYLLDQNKGVILKDVYPEEIIMYLNK